MLGEDQGQLLLRCCQRSCRQGGKQAVVLLLFLLLQSWGGSIPAGFLGELIFALHTDRLSFMIQLKMDLVKGEKWRSVCETKPESEKSS